MIRIKLSTLLGERKMTRTEVSLRTGIRPNTIGEYYYDLNDRISMEHMDLICDALDCELWELLERVPGKKKRPKYKSIRDYKNAHQ